VNGEVVAHALDRSNIYAALRTDGTATKSNEAVRNGRSNLDTAELADRRDAWVRLCTAVRGVYHGRVDLHVSSSSPRTTAVASNAAPASPNTNDHAAQKPRVWTA